MRALSAAVLAVLVCACAPAQANAGVELSSPTGARAHPGYLHQALVQLPARTPLLALSAATVDGERWLRLRSGQRRGWVPQRLTSATRPERVPACRSRSLGPPSAGRLLCGKPLAVQGSTWTTWDFPLRRPRNRAWRRYGSDRLLRTVRLLGLAYARRFPHAPRLVIGDLSRPNGGRFGAEFGGIGHRTHQNGLDVDIFYPRRDLRERAPTRPGQVALARSQWLVGHLARSRTTQHVYVGPRVGLSLENRKVTRLSHHDDHLHLRVYRAR